MSKYTVRVQMELPQPAVDRLKTLTDKTEAVSYEEVTKNAYRLYEMIIEMQESGRSLMVKEPSGEIRELQIFQILV